MSYLGPVGPNSILMHLTLQLLTYFGFVNFWWFIQRRTILEYRLFNARLKTLTNWRRITKLDLCVTTAWTMLLRENDRQTEHFHPLSNHDNRAKHPNHDWWHCIRLVRILVLFPCLLFMFFPSLSLCYLSCGGSYYAHSSAHYLSFMQ